MDRQAPAKVPLRKKLAKKISFIYVDTGAMYRAMAYYFIQKGVDKDDIDTITKLCKDVEVSISYENGEQQVILNGENITGFIRQEAVGNMASATSVYPVVREKLVELQRQLAARENVVMDGRDIGTTVLPDAFAKIYLTASSDARAKRRYDELKEKGENCSESVFELQCTATESQPGSNDIGSQFASVQGVRGAGEWNLGWGQHTATQELADAFEEGDPRKDETLLYFIRNGKDDPESIPANKPYGEKPISNADVIAKYFNKKAYTDPAMRLKFTKGGYWVNIRLIRYADVVLMASEAACELGDLSSARNYLEMVRARARGNNIGILPEVTTNNQNELREAIRHERRVELGMEFDRFYDLVRWGIAKEVLHAAGKTGYQDRHALLPIPQDEIDKSNGVLVQNPNY